MKKSKISIIFLSFAMMFLFACGGGTTNENSDENSHDQEVSENTTSNEMETTNEVAQPENENKSGCGFEIASVEDFLYYVAPEGIPATFESESGDYLFFREDGTMAGGNANGESSMWEANWEFVPATPTGKIKFTVTMQPSDDSHFLSGQYHVEYFPDDAALIFDCVDYFKQDY